MGSPGSSHAATWRLIGLIPGATAARPRPAKGRSCVPSTPRPQMRARILGRLLLVRFWSGAPVCAPRRLVPHRPRRAMHRAPRWEARPCLQSRGPTTRFSSPSPQMIQPTRGTRITPHRPTRDPRRMQARLGRKTNGLRRTMNSSTSSHASFAEHDVPFGSRLSSCYVRWGLDELCHSEE